jgi:hypothetical protein
MALVKMDPKAESRPHLPTAGLYGLGKGDFDVKLTRFEHPAEERMPAYDREGEKGPYAYFGFECRSDEQGLVFYDHWEPIGPGTGSRESTWLNNLGVDVTPNGEFDDSTVAGRECIIQVKDPREDKKTGRIYNGNLQQIIGS